MRFPVKDPKEYPAWFPVKYPVNYTGSTQINGYNKIPAFANMFDKWSFTSQVLVQWNSESTGLSSQPLLRINYNLNNKTLMLWNYLP